MEEIEIWKDIPDYKGLYQVSNLGRIKSLYFGKERILKTHKDKYGYLISHLHNNSKGKTHFVHRLVALAFIPNPENYPMINHKDESRDNNCVENLEWCDCKYNLNYGSRNIRLSKAKKGKPLTEEHKQNMSKAKKGKPLTKKGKPLTEEHKQKIGITKKGKPLTEEHKQNMSKAISKPIIQFTLEGVFIREWQSATIASRELNINQSNISACCKGRYKTCRGFIWKYKDVE